MKPYPGYKGNNLTDIVATAIAFVNQGANKKEFFLLKRKDGKGMDKQKAIDLIKTGKLDDGEMDAIVSSVPEADQADVKKEADAMKKSATSSEAVEKLVDVAVEKVGAKISKEVMTKINEISATLKGAVSKLEALGNKPPVDTKKKGDETTEDPEKELTDEEATALIEKTVEAGSKEEGEEK
jgi:hypothetical protein